MLKGATIAGWLYDVPTRRTYDDLDILVRPADEAAVVEVLGGLGYQPLLGAPTLRVISPEEQPLRNSRGVTIDLHVAIKGVGLSPDRAWAILVGHTVPWNWAGIEVPALDPSARTMNLALHLSQLGLADTKAAHDLRLGLDRLDDGVWRAAANLAGELQALQAFAAGLVLLPEGEALADRLGVPRPTNVEDLMRTSGEVFPPTVALERLLATPGLRRKLSATWSYVFPSADWLRHVDPQATAGRWGLLRARVRRPFRLLPRVARALRERRRFRSGRHG